MSDSGIEQACSAIAGLEPFAKVRMHWTARVSGGLLTLREVDLQRVEGPGGCTITYRQNQKHGQQNERLHNGLSSDRIAVFDNRRKHWLLRGHTCPAFRIATGAALVGLSSAKHRIYAVERAISRLAVCVRWFRRV